MVSIRNNKKAQKIFYGIMGKPNFMIDKKTKREKDIDHILAAQGWIRTMYK